MRDGCVVLFMGAIKLVRRSVPRILYKFYPEGQHIQVADKIAILSFFLATAMHPSEFPNRKCERDINILSRSKQ